MNIITIIGARPQFIKAVMVSRAIERHNKQYPFQAITERLLHTGQHYDDEMSAIFFRQLQIPTPTWNLNCTLPESMTEKIITILRQERPDQVLVYGDTNSTLAGALAAHQLNIPLIHIEAGLRSYNQEMPEEKNRIIADQLSSILFCPTPKAIDNLRKEGIIHGVFWVGDVMFDAAKALSTSCDILQRLCIHKPFYLLTIHRAENTNHIERLMSILQALQSVSTPIIWPMHPRTRKTISENKSLQELLFECRSIRVIDSQGYLEMATLEKEASLILTDSGGVQKEAYFHKTPCLTLREETEWQETIIAGSNLLVGTDSNRILEGIQNPPDSFMPISDFGDGHAAEKIVQIIANNNL